MKLVWVWGASFQHHGIIERRIGFAYGSADCPLSGPRSADRQLRTTLREIKQISAALARRGGGRTCSEPPTVSFEIASPVLALTIWGLYHRG
jgi:hypothetical protein